MAMEGAGTNNAPGVLDIVKEKVGLMNVPTAHPEPEIQPYSSKRRMNELGAHTRSLPTEIVAEIFQNCITPFQDYHPGADTSIPLKLGAVCHTWRNTARGCQHLWSSITLVISDREKAPCKISLLLDWLSRSGKLPLSIRLYCDSASDWSRDVRQTVCETLNLYVPRWYEVDFRVPSGFEYLPSDTILPLLQFYSMTLSMDFEGRSHQIRLSQTPQLHRLSLDCGGLYLRSFFFEWHRLTDLEVSGVYVDECMDLLRRTPDIAKFAVHRFYYGDDDYPEPSHPIELNSLESIVLNNSSIDRVNLIPLFKNLIIPKAKKFKYFGRTKGYCFPVDEFADFLNRSACSLTTLSFVHTLVTEADLFTIFPLTTSLQSLSFTSDRKNQDRPFFTENIWRSLNPSKADSPYLLPRLEYLEYDGPLDFTWEVVLEAIEGRYRGSLEELDPNPGFKSLLFYIRGPPLTIDPEIQLTFERWKSVGLHLEIQDIAASS